MPPKFSLQPILDYRHNRVEVLEIELSQLLGFRQQTLASLEVLFSDQSNLFEQLAEKQQGVIDFQAVSQIRTNLRMIENNIQELQSLLVELERRVEAKQNEVVGAKQNEEMLVILKNKENERYQSQLNYQENRLQDDAYIAQAYRRTAGLSQ
jgi:flagellar export protein FliJ